jgi:hypothetical protein
VTCIRCRHAILPGQLYRLFRRDGLTTTHVACPTEREVQIAHRWGRWL